MGGASPPAALLPDFVCILREHEICKETIFLL